MVMCEWVFVGEEVIGMIAGEGVNRCLLEKE